MSSRQSRGARPFLTKQGDFTTLIARAIETTTGHKPKFSTTGGTSDARFIHLHCPVAEIGLAGTITGVVLVHASHGLVLAVWIASAAFASVDGSLEEAARNIGASAWTCFRTITLPLAAPGLMASAIFVFLESLDEFTGTYFVGVPDVTTLPLLMFNASMGGNYQIASITALLLLVPSIGFMLVVERFLKADVLAMVGR